MPEQNSDPKSNGKIRVITNMLKTALKLWLKAQVTQVSQIEVEIKASDRQLLSGKIPWVSIFASHAVYRGLHIGKIQLVAENIQVNIGSVIKGKPLRLLETVPVFGELSMEEQDLNQSLSSELLATALNDVLVKLLPEHCTKTKSTTWQEIILDTNQIILSGILASEGESTPVKIFLGLQLINAQELQLAPIQIQYDMVVQTESNQEHNIDLGPEVDIQELTLIPGKLVCRGRINVNP
ncbi:MULTISPECIES: LmeA family phospholipid-binding protein [unclassified Tolypothrix]|uniref:LmeA family phospholipid-binding protein n=1 Tax=unclassified Tolypothrix TaxID=2649714 RepID=UPI0005EAA277|nr:MULTISPECIES: DUF2993 domain-containing protein [unclassified Tolypothrix]BAY91703.1 hypothetical protein NIES3275_37280 [Microchaete diplosiphon NIES-3275]EKF05174.1 hypothetical protein FDUTEX481_01344 [Tolypothrix sp. PCC 7601]MBE9084327.1 DUF2993 domain-containing protein [Tolypothrix sp. LEGE 11397]UYD25719.1 DUF2993 domain-containing protein [Tolypothrix sp. PCC 7712]UYD32040.1 DUF2993 domain-containing protein [Tolypothrix sp. PCC 7601]